MLGSLWRMISGAGVAAFTVHEPPHASGTRLARAERLLFVRDGFSWRAALFSPVYLIVRGEWLALAAYAGAAILAIAILNLAGAKTDWIVWTFLILNVLTGFEASEIKRWSLGRAGWQEIATVSGRGPDEAERRFFEAWLPSIPVETPGSSGNPDPGHDTVSRMENALRGFSQSLRTRYATKA
ncbi:MULTISPECIES: DUF2628 domain-containing protein [Hyphomicrobium]|uniref:DUF2628 domain-containing protein n=1 Tax=Hyphomicrobium TaxID=81 RepID=UPI00037AE36F|nr:MULTISPECIES: DUF2628 domain-containing protein [Hyphomicrobium]WBT38373.1 DUF2628 domain-containing protein [Hyphomicrobium sp. DMF-1]